MFLSKPSKAASGLATRRWNPSLVSSEKAEECARYLRQWGWNKKTNKRTIGIGSTNKRTIGLNW